MGRRIADGQCYWRRHRSQWGVWKKKRSADGFEDDEFIRDFTTMEAARAFVYSENGWI